MRKVLFVLIAAAFSLSAHAYEVPWQRLHDACDQYLQVCVAKSDVTAMDSKLKSRVRQRVADNPDQADDVAMRSIMLDWAASNQKSLEKKQADVIRQACFYFLIFHEKGFDVPHQIREQLTQGNVNEMLEYLDGEVAKKKK